MYGQGWLVDFLPAVLYIQYYTAVYFTDLQLCNRHELSCRACTSCRCASLAGVPALARCTTVAGGCISLAGHAALCRRWPSSRPPCIDICTPHSVFPPIKLSPAIAETDGDLLCRNFPAHGGKSGSIPAAQPGGRT
jgi:hypothetical protein